MKYLSMLPVALALLLCTTQCKTSKTQEDTYIKNVLPVEREIETTDYSNIETFASFSGGEKARLKFLKDNMKYPPEAQKWNIKGDVVVGFIVDVDGTLANIKILISSGIPLFDAEVLRVTEIMPKWIPAKDKDGKSCSSSFAMKVRFK